MNPTLRILDANLNRAREALRIIDDYARFALDDRDAAAAAKRLRHAVAAIAHSLGEPELLAARDILGDVGRETKLPSEQSRESLAAVVAAEFSRLTESLRSIAECGKLISQPSASVAEQLRYDAYELQQRICLRADLRQRFRAVRLYVIVTVELCAGDWQAVASAAIHGGATCLQLREKNIDDRELLRRAHILRDLTRSAGALLIINDRPDIARLVRADGVHVGQDDLSVADVRRIAGADLLVGKSTHTIEQFDAATAERPDYIAIGPMFDTSTKPQSHIAGIETLRAVAKRTDLPIVAIGGITAATATTLRESGAACICVCSAVIASPDPQRAARELC